jgi:glycosyltransferase involved in cell wall biosynthesis
MPLVTVIIPTYNRAPLIGRAVSSVRAQTLTDFDVVVIDDASDDDTAQVLAEIADPRLGVRRLDIRSGPGAARNAALTDLDCRYAAFLDSDDVMAPERLARQIEVLTAEPELVVLGSDHYRASENGESVETIHTGNRRPFDFAWNALFNLPCHFPTVTVRADPLRAGARFRDNRTFAEDAWFVGDLLAHGRGRNLAESLTTCHDSAGQYSRRFAVEIRASLDAYCQAQLARLGFDLPVTVSAALRRYVLVNDRQAWAARHPGIDLHRLATDVLARLKAEWNTAKTRGSRCAWPWRPGRPRRTPW